jgi:hypothetical protein
MESKFEKWLDKRGKDIKQLWIDRASDCAGQCESPMEKLFYIEWVYQTDDRDSYDNIYVMPQFKIDNYRVDFLIYTNTDKYWMSKEFSYPQYNKKNSLIIEIDSYLWHGSTPEQFAKEKERERYLQKNGWIMHRYSGSEIYKNVEKCVEEELEYIVNIETEILTQELNKIEKEGIYDSK